MPPHHSDLIVWRKGMDLLVLAYALADRLPSDDPIGDDLRATAVAIPSRIAKGHGSEELRLYRRNVDIAHGKVARMESLLFVAEQMRRLPADDPDVTRARELCAEIARMLTTLYTSLRLREQERPAE